jgi:hypothetical protein
VALMDKLKNDNPGGSALLAVLFGLGMLLVFIGERLIGSGRWRWLTAVGAALVLLVFAVRVRRAANVTGEASYVEATLAKLYLGGIVALVLYFMQSDLWEHVAGAPLAKGFPTLSGALAALWPAVWVATALPGVLVEIAYSVVQVTAGKIYYGTGPVTFFAGLLMTLVGAAVKTAQQTDLAAGVRAPKIELGRIRDAMYTGFGMAGALVFAFAIVYVASERDSKVDLSYFRTAKPGEATRKLVASLDSPVEVDLFFPSANEVRSQVEGYFDDLKKESKLLEVHRYDHALDPAKAKEVGVSGNGILAIKRGGRKELLSVGLDLEGSRSQLSNLDKEINKRLLQVAKPQRTVYLSYGHGERTDTATGGDTDKRGTIRDLRELLVQQGYLVRNLGAADGLAADVPSDAALVLTIGPQKPFLPEETAAMERFLDRGGRWFLALDPENGAMKELTELLALSYTPVVLANDQVFARKSYQPGDRSNIATGSYSSHPSVTTLSHLGMRAPMIFVGAGPLEEIAAKDRPATRKDLSIDFTVRSHMATWNDIDGNFNLDAPKEQRRVWNLGAAVTRKKPGNKPADETRALVLGDSDLLTDGVVGNPGNAYYVLDGVKWLLGDEALAGEVSSEVDVPVMHTRKQDTWWFWSTVGVAPLLALSLGRRMTRRRARKEKA